MTHAGREQDPEVVAERALERFREVCVTALPLRSELAAELAAEARPAVHALLFATSTDKVDDPESLEHHETLAMVTLLARKLALLGATPTAALRLMPTLLDAVRAIGWDVPSRLDASLTTVAMEGFVRGREERLAADAARDAVERIAVVALAPSCLAICLRGAYDGELLEGAMEEIARRLFREQVRACLVLLDGMIDPTPSAARAALSLDESARTIGATAIYAGMRDDFRAAAERGGVDLAHLHLVDDPTEGVRQALSIAGYALRKASWLPLPLRDWFRG